MLKHKPPPAYREESTQTASRRLEHQMKRDARDLAQAVGPPLAIVCPACGRLLVLRDAGYRCGCPTP